MNFPDAIALTQERRLWSIWAERLGGLRAMAQAAIGEGLTLDPRPLAQDVLAAAVVDIGWGKVAKALMGVGVL